MHEDNGSFQLPLQGDRDYITGVQLAEAAIRLAAQRQIGTIANLTINCYRMIQQNGLSAVFSTEPLSPKLYDAIIRCRDADSDTEHHIGINAAGEATTDWRVECPEQELSAFVKPGADRRAEFSNPGRDDASFLTMLILATKLASQQSFPDIREKWIFASGSLAAVPDQWSGATVTSQSEASAHFFRWTVEVDGAPLGHINFFHIAR